MNIPPLTFTKIRHLVKVIGIFTLFFTLTFAHVQQCLASEQTYDGKTLVVVGTITGGNGVRSLSGLTYNRPTAAGSFTFIPAGDYYVDARIVNPVYFFKQLNDSPQVRTAILGSQSCQQRYSNYPGVGQSLVSPSIGVSGYITVTGLGCVNIDSGSLGWDFGFFGSPITYDPSKFTPAIVCPDPAAEAAFLANCPGSLGSYDCATATGECAAPPCSSTTDTDDDGFNQCEDCDDGDNTKTSQCKPDQLQGSKDTCP